MWNLFLNPVELIATFTGVISVILSWRKNIYTYFFGLINVSLYVYLCFYAGLYAEMGINIFYFIMSIYGWINWHRLLKQNRKFIPYSLSRKEFILYFLITILIWAVIFLVLSQFTDSDVPVADSFTTAFFITGMILMAKKITENWIFLIMGNLASIPLFIYKELYVSSVFFVILTVFAFLGFYNWKKNSQKIMT